MRIKRNQAAGKAMDVASYLGIRCNEDYIITYFRSKFDNVGEAMSLYYGFKEKCKDYILPDEITPFVYIDHGTGASNFLAQYLSLNLNYVTCTEEDISALLHNEKLMQRQFLEITFPKAANPIIDDLMRKGTASVHAAGLIMELSYPNDIRLHISLMIPNFSAYHKVLLKTYQDFDRFMGELHNTKEAQQTFDKIAELVKDPAYNIVERFRNIHKLPDAVYSFPFYFTLINPYILHYSNHGPKQICFGLGAHFRDQVESQYHMKHVTLQTHYRLMGSERRYAVVELFSEYQMLCAADITHHLQAHRSAAHTNLNMLLSYSVIMLASPDKTKVKNARVYYKANPEYFKVIVAETRALNHKWENVNHAGVEKYARPKRKRRSDYQGDD